jgi:thiamine biosynthesis lipoprotein
MRLTRRRFILSAAAIAGGAAAPMRGRSATLVWRGAALGGEATIRLRGERDAAGAALAECAAEIRRLERLFSLQDPGSALAALNATGRLDAPALDFLAVLRAAERWRVATGGAFDVRVQPLWRAAARGGDVEAARASAFAAPVRATAAAVSLPRGVALTFNGIAQGTIADRVAALLARRGFGEAAIDTGEMRLPGADALAVAVPELGARLLLAGTALAVSVPGALRFADGTGHIIDPRGAMRAHWRAVAALAPDAETADALSTACAVSSPDAIGDMVARSGFAVLARAQDGALRRFGDAGILRRALGPGASVDQYQGE